MGKLLVAALDPVANRHRCLSTLTRDPRCSTPSRFTSLSPSDCCSSHHFGLQVAGVMELDEVSGQFAT